MRAHYIVASRELVQVNIIQIMSELLDVDTLVVRLCVVREISACINEIVNTVCVQAINATEKAESAHPCGTYEVLSVPVLLRSRFLVELHLLPAHRCDLLLE